MSMIQNIAKHVLSDRLYESMRNSSERWVMQCSCGAETSVWQMGGIRWGAAGEPRRMGKCAACGRIFWGKVSRANGDGQAAPTNQRTAKPIELNQTLATLLWLDGVGCWMAFHGGQLTIGGPVQPGSSQLAADLCVLANLSRMHATIERTGETYHLQTVDADGSRYLRDRDDISLGSHLTMQFRMPSVLSPTAVLTPASQPWPRMFTCGRTPSSVDGIVLMDEVCLLGPGGDAHVPCPDWAETVILFRRDGQLWCRSQSVIDVDGETVTKAQALSQGSVISGQGWRFRVESVCTNNQGRQ